MPRAIVIGNAAWDETFHVGALPAPGASIHARRGAAGLGGKGANQAVVLARAGVGIRLLAAVGGDAAGDAAAASLAAEGLAGDLFRPNGVTTDRTVVLLADDGVNAVVTTRDAASALDAERVGKALASCNGSDLCVLGGNLSAAATEAATAAARRCGLVVALNPSPMAPWLAPLVGRADALFVNAEEAEALTGRTGEAAARALLALGPHRVVLTLGPRGALLASEAGVEAVPAAPARAVDPTGAGDALLGASLAHAMPRGWLLDAAAVAAGARAGAVAVSRGGAFDALPSREELTALMAA